MMLPDDPNWQMTLLFLLALALLGFVMKLVALSLPTKGQIQRRGISWVLVSPGVAHASSGELPRWSTITYCKARNCASGHHTPAWPDSQA